MTQESAVQLLEFVALTLPAVLFYMGVLYVILRVTSRTRPSRARDGQPNRAHGAPRRHDAGSGRSTQRGRTPDTDRFQFWRTTALQQKDFTLALASLLLLLASVFVLGSALMVPSDAALLLAQGLILLSFLALLLSFGATFYLSIARSHDLRGLER